MPSSSDIDCVRHHAQTAYGGFRKGLGAKFENGRKREKVFGELYSVLAKD